MRPFYWTLFIKQWRWPGNSSNDYTKDSAVQIYHVKRQYRLREYQENRIDNYFLAKSGLYHYLGTAMGNYREYLGGAFVKLKKYFYVIRPLLACKSRPRL